ncbi:MAG: hypothetical protein NTY24_12100, partial [Mycobacterium sp.]|nr:hypothetical protein [Mycobacterium sp.]
MFIGAVVSLLLAALIGGSGLWTLGRRSPADLTGQVMRLVAPTQVAAAVMLAAAGVIALRAPARVGVGALIVGLAGAVGTVAAGSWQGARYASSRESATVCGSDG